MKSKPQQEGGETCRKEEEEGIHDKGCKVSVESRERCTYVSSIAGVKRHKFYSYRFYLLPGRGYGVQIEPSLSETTPSCSAARILLVGNRTLRSGARAISSPAVELWRLVLLFVLCFIVASKECAVRLSYTPVRHTSTTTPDLKGSYSVSPVPGVFCLP